MNLTERTIELFSTGDKEETEFVINQVLYGHITITENFINITDKGWEQLRLYFESGD